MAAATGGLHLGARLATTLPLVSPQAPGDRSSAPYTMQPPLPPVLGHSLMAAVAVLVVASCRVALDGEAMPLSQVTTRGPPTSLVNTCIVPGT